MERNLSRKAMLVLSLGLLAALLVLVVPEARLHSFARVAILAGAAMSLNLLIGNAGLISIAQALFLGLGAYVIAVANIKYGVTFGKAAMFAIVASIVTSSVVAAIALRARALFFALLTLAIAQVFYVLVARNYDLTGGDDGLVGITIPMWADSEIAQYLLAVASTTVVSLALLALIASPFGATLRAIRDNSDRVASLGGNPKLYEFSAFVIAGVLASFSGVALAIIDRAVEPGLISWTTGTELLVMVALGGRSTFLGPIAGAVILELARSTVQRYSTHADLVVGLIVIACAVSMPEGIGAAIAKMRLKLGREAKAPLPARTPEAGR